jgi:hypothetical protein
MAFGQTKAETGSSPVWKAEDMKSLANANELRWAIVMRDARTIKVR